VALYIDLRLYYALDEASGDALDSYGFAEHLTETSGTIAATTGKVAGCRDFELGDTEYFTGASSLRNHFEDLDWTIAAWVNLESIATSQYLVSKWNTTGNQRSYGLIYNTGTTNFEVLASSAGTSATTTTLPASTFGTPSTGVWYFIVARYDATGDQLAISVNAGTVDTASHSGGVFDSTAAFRLGARGDGTLNLDGLLDEVGIWLRRLSDAEVTELYNSGSGRDYAYIISGGGGVVIPALDEGMLRGGFQHMSGGLA